MATKTNSKKVNIAGVIFFVLQVLASVALVVLLMQIAILPTKFLIVIAAILAALCIISLIMQLSQHGKVVGLIYSIIIAAVLITGSAYLWKTNKALTNVSAASENSTITSRMSILVLADSGMEGLQDLAGQAIGIQSTLDQAKTKQSLSELQIHFESELPTVSYNSYITAATGLYSGEVNAIIFNEAFRGLVEETYPNFNTETKALQEFTYKEIIKTPEKESENSIEHREDVKVAQEPFIVYLSGNDGYGEVDIDGGRSDVNILAVINPETKEILLVTTPRDGYVELPWGSHDKLTHASIWGLDTSVEVLEDLYGFAIDYYARINFSGFEAIVDALGGVSVYSAEDFTTFAGTYFHEGYNDVDGATALTFVRERYNLSGGDLARGKNQMRMIQAIIDKITSPAILTSYMPLMDSLSSAVATNMPKDKISSLVKMQMEDNAAWHITSYEVQGEGNWRVCYSSGDERSVVDLYDYSVEEAISKMQDVIDGKHLSD
ncbi:MAG: LCP family protein [Firmicutes bacterium]|nr:LCP family protein [Bacillota bacterium]